MICLPAVIMLLSKRPIVSHQVVQEAGAAARKRKHNVDAKKIVDYLEPLLQVR